MKRKNRLLTAGLLLALAIVAFAAAPSAHAADTLTRADDSAYLNARSTQLGCTLDFHLSVMNSIQSQVGDPAGLAPSISKLQADKTQLASLASAGNQSAFAAFVQGTLAPDTKAANDAVTAARQGYKSDNLSRSTRATLIANSKSARSTYTACVSQGKISVATARAAYYTKVLGDAQTKATSWSQKGYDTTGMAKVISDAQTTIVTPLQTAASSNDATQAEAALKQYCLYNGCKAGTNFHFAAKFAIATLSAIMDKISANATAAGLGDDVTAVQTQITAANTALAAIGTAEYNGQAGSDSVWNPIRAAEQALKKLRDDWKAKEPKGNTTQGQSP